VPCADRSILVLKQAAALWADVRQGGYRLYNICERKKWADGALAYKMVA
jgi:hypothetical protein